MDYLVIWQFEYIWFTDRQFFLFFLMVSELTWKNQF